VNVTVFFGSREKYWGDQAEQAKEYIDLYLDGWPRLDRIIAGHSPGGGTDIWVEESCLRHGIAFTPYPPDWRPHGVYNPRAAFDRNEEMAQIATKGIGICPATVGVTRGSYDMWTRLLKHRKPVEMLFI
jgi:hypothetical protein